MNSVFKFIAIITFLASSSVWAGSSAKSSARHPTQASAGCNCDDDFLFENTEGKIQATEIILIEEMQKDMKAKIKDIDQLQESIGMNEEDSGGRLSALGQLIDLMERTFDEAKNKNTFSSFSKAQKEISEIHKEALSIP